MIFSNNSKFGTVCCVLLQFLIIAVITVAGARSRTWEGKLVFQEDFDGEHLSSKWERVGSCEGIKMCHPSLHCVVSKSRIR